MEKLEAILKDIFESDIESLRAAGELKQLEKWDSLNHVRLIVALESDYQTEFTEQEIMAMVSVDEIIRVLKEKGVYE
jgi:acyl carrier protein